MSGIALLKGAPIAGMAGPNAALLPNLIANSPREIWVAAASGNINLYFDFGIAVLFDSFYLGSTNAVAGDTWTIYSVTSLAGANPSLRVPATPIRLTGTGARASCFAPLAAPFTARYLHLQIATTNPNPFEVGVFCAGARFEHPYAWGAGRQAIDLSGVTQLADGGFGIEEAAMKATFKWKFVDLSDAKREDLWAFVMDRGIRQPFVLVEDIDAIPYRASQIHYCKFDRLEPYERQDPAATVWALSAEQWL